MSLLEKSDKKVTLTQLLTYCTSSIRTAAADLRKQQIGTTLSPIAMNASQLHSEKFLWKRKYSLINSKFFASLNM